jgi:hypothetical protein
MYLALAPISRGDEQRWIGLPMVIESTASCRSSQSGALVSSSGGPLKERRSTVLEAALR